VRFALPLVLLALVVGIAPSDQQAPPAFRASVDIVPVYATVTRPDGTFAGGLTKDDFVVLDNGKPQDIASFASTAQTISVSVILDTSSTMSSTLPRVFGAARVFLKQLLPEDRAMVGSLFYIGPPMSSDKSRLGTSLDLLPRDPGSPVWAALDRSLTALTLESNRKVIVIYSAGKNKNVGPFQATTPARLVSRVETAGVMVYAIGFEGASISKDLKAIASRSGGRATELGASADLSAALAAVADELHHQYLLGFTPAAFDGQVHKLDVRVKDAALSVRARQSYVAIK
jgi:Ca-activated chloride channel family protein